MSTLHPTRTLTALLPKYVSRFSCIGPSCEDNCCTGWRVTIDKKTFNAYRQSKHPELTPRFEANVNRQRSQASDVNYARIMLTPETGACPFMEERLCAIQREMNESYLSDTCFSYPRQTRHFNSQYEQALTLSCPEAARQALLAADAFDFIENTITVRPSVIAEVKPQKGLSPNLMNEIRIFCLQLMRTQELELWQRLAVLGLFCESLSKLLTEGKQAAIPELLESFTQMVEQGLVIDALSEMLPNHRDQAWVFAFFWWRKPKFMHSEHSRQVVESCAKGLGFNEQIAEIPVETVIERYTQGVLRLPEALQAAPHLLENYVLNEMFRDVFPFDGNNLYEHYLKLVSRFGLIRLMLAAQCNTHDSLPDATTLVKTVQVFCRLFQHDDNFATQVNKALSTTGFDKLEKVYGFLRS